MQADLRFILLLIGVVVITAIIWDGFRRKSEKKYRNKHNKVLNPLHNEPSDIIEEGKQIEKELETEKTQGQKEPLSQEKEEIASESIISLTILPTNSKGFNGRMLASVLKDAQFQLGPHNIFHQYMNNDPNQEIVSSLTSIIEPGEFNPKTYLEQTYPGLILFMIIPKVLNPYSLFDKMLIQGRQLAISLNAYLCDDKRQYLTLKTIENYRDKIRQLTEMPVLKKNCGEG